MKRNSCLFMLHVSSKGVDGVGVILKGRGSCWIGKVGVGGCGVGVGMTRMLMKISMRMIMHKTGKPTRMFFHRMC